MTTAPLRNAPLRPIEASSDPAARDARGSDPGDATLDGVERLEAGVARLAALRKDSLATRLNAALEAINTNDPGAGAKFALEALEEDDRCAVAWHVLAICLERADDFTGALKCYDTAFALEPADVRLSHDLGRLAYRMGFLDQAEALFLRYLKADPGSALATNNLANVYRDQFRFDDAVEAIRTALDHNPQSAVLWNTLGTVFAEQGDMDRALIFIDEALRLQPDFPKARYNRANALLERGQVKLAQLECEAALDGSALDSERAMMRLARATMLLAGGAVGEGWDAYEARHDQHFNDVLFFLAEAPPWTPDMTLAGKALLLIGEQGLGDEILFANVVPDVLKALGPEGRLTLAVERRLQPLFQRSFPQAEILEHVTGTVRHHAVRSVLLPRPWSEVDAFTPLGSMLRAFRRETSSFPDHDGYLVPDPQRVALWRERLDALPGLKAGTVWKSNVRTSARARFFPRFEDWAPIFAVPGVTFVNLQYGESAEEIAYARSQFGVEIWTPPGLDLKNDIDELAALMRALDVVIGPPNAATMLAAAVGTRTLLQSYIYAWPRLGTRCYPWFPALSAFILETERGWPGVCEDIGAALRPLAAETADRRAP